MSVRRWQKDHHCYLPRPVKSAKEALALILDNRVEDLGELSGEDQPCSTAKFEDQKTSEVDDDGTSSPKQRWLAAVSSDSLLPAVFKPIRQNT